MSRKRFAVEQRNGIPQMVQVELFPGKSEG